MDTPNEGLTPKRLISRSRHARFYRNGGFIGFRRSNMLPLNYTAGLDHSSTAAAPVIFERSLAIVKRYGKRSDEPGRHGGWVTYATKSRITVESEFYLSERGEEEIEVTIKYNGCRRCKMRSEPKSDHPQKIHVEDWRAGAWQERLFRAFRIPHPGVIAPPE